PHAHGLHAFADQVANGIVDHRGGDARPESEAVSEVGGDIEFTAAHVNVALVSLAKGDDAGIEPVDQSTEGKKIESAVGADLQSFFVHSCSKNTSRRPETARAPRAHPSRWRTQRATRTFENGGARRRNANRRTGSARGRRVRSSWYGRTGRGAYPLARKCVRRRSRAVPARDSPAGGRCGIRRRTRARLRMPASAHRIR